MGPENYRIESAHPITHRLFPLTKTPRSFRDASVAVAIAAKCVPSAWDDEVRVVHVPTGQIIFRKSGRESAHADLDEI